MNDISTKTAGAILTGALAMVAGPALGATQNLTGATSDWQTYSINLPTDKTFDARVTIGISNQGDTLADPEMLIDGLGGGVGFGAVAGNRGFEKGGSAGFTTAGWSNVRSTPIFGAAPSEGSYMLRQSGTGTSTADYRNANGVAGTDGSLLSFIISSVGGGLLSFNWNFFNNEVGPYVFNDFAFVSIDSVNGDPYNYYDVLAQVASPPTPVPFPAALWLFASGLIGTLGAARVGSGTHGARDQAQA